jgi:branched-chain amino acid transport system ATP-binding protein
MATREDASTESSDASSTEPAGSPILQTEGLTKRFGSLTAVDSVDLAIPRGEFRSVIGPNGAGKTTLFNLLTGVMSPTEGRVRFAGEDVTALAPHERVRRGIGRSFQITTVFGGLTVGENVRLAAQAVEDRSFSPTDWLFRPANSFDAVNRRASEALESVGLAALADELAASLAYGDRRRLELGIVLATDPELVLLDEPTAGMSREETVDTMRLIKRALDDRTLVLIEHDVDLVMNVSDQVTVLDRGSILASGTPQEISNDESVQAAYFGGER